MSKTMFEILLNISSSNSGSTSSEHSARHISSAETAVPLSSKEEAEEIYKASLEVNSG